MDREQYIKNLQDVLKERFSQQQANDILADYSEFFDAGIAEGKSESELCTEFGSPERVALELVNSNSTEQQRWPTHLRLKVIFILTAIANLMLLPFICWSYSVFPSVYIFLLPFALQAIIIVGTSHNITTISADSSKLCRMRQGWFCGWRLVVLLLVLSSVLACQCIWLNNRGIFYFLYVAVLALITYICIVRSIYPAKSERFHHLKTILFACYLFIVVSFIALFILINMEDKQLLDRGSAGFWYVLLLSSIIALSISTGILAIIYAVHRKAETKWLIFLNTTFFSLAFNISWVLGYGPVGVLKGSFTAFSFSIVQNSIAMVLFLLFSIIQRNLKERGAKNFEHANENE